MRESKKLTLQPRTLESADSEQRAILERAAKQVGFIPNMYACMVNSPGLLATYLEGYALFRNNSGFTPAEQEVVFLTISRENTCHYCVAAHSTLADKMSGVPEDVTNAIRCGTPVPDARLEVLRAFTREMVTSRGYPSREGVRRFLAAGYSERQVLEIVLAIAVKTLSNYSNHLFDTPVDDMFSHRSWSG